LKEAVESVRSLRQLSSEGAAGSEIGSWLSSIKWPSLEQNVNPNVDLARYVMANGTQAFMALTDQTMYTRFEGDALETIESDPCPWHDEMCKGMLAGAGLTAAHEKYDYATGEHFNFVGNFGLFSNTYKLIKYTDGQEKFERWSGPEFQVKNLSFVHSAHLTDKHFILQVPPAHYDMLSLMMKKPAYNASVYDPYMPTLWYVLDRATGELKATYDAANVQWTGRPLAVQTYFRGEGIPGSIMHSHTVNAFEGADGSLTMDFIGWPDMSIFYGISLELIRDNPRDYQETWEPARLTRCVIQTTDKSVGCEILVDTNFGLPNINVEHYQSKPYNFVYGTSISSKDADFIDVLSKVDIAKRRITHTWSEEGCFVTEPVFVARPGGATEDDGVLLSVIYNSKREMSFMIVLDASNMQELARFDVGFKIQAHYHGKFCKAYGDHACVGS